MNPHHLIYICAFSFSAIIFALLIIKKNAKSKPCFYVAVTNARLSEGYNIHFSKDSDNLTLSPLMEELLKIGNNSLNFKGFCEYLCKEDSEEFIKFCNLSKDNPSFKQGITTHFIIKLKSKYFKLTKQTLRNKRLSVAGTIIFLEDVTKELLEKEALQKENEQAKLDLIHFNNILNRLPIAIWERDQDLIIKYFNHAYSKLIAHHSVKSSGCEADELDKHQKAFAHMVQEESREKTEERYIIAENRRRLFQITEAPINDKTILGYAIDYTDKDEIKKELDRHIAAQSELLEISASATAIYGNDARLRFYNQAFVRLWGVDEKWLATKPNYDQLLEKLREKRKLPEQVNFKAFKEAQLKLFTDLIETHNEFFYLPDGRTLRVIVVPHTLGGVLFSYEDMTDRLALERSYNTLMAVQKATIDKLDEGVAVYGEDSRLRLYNNLYSRIWGLDTEFLNSEPRLSEVLDLISPHLKVDSIEEYKNQMIIATANKNGKEIIVELKSGDIIKRTCVALPDGASLVTCVDITDTMLVERSLRERNLALLEAAKMKTEFLENISYELRSPLTSIMGFAEIMKEEFFGGLNAKQKEYLAAIYNSSEYLMMLINDILDLSSFETENLTLDLVEFDLYEALTSIILLFDERIKELKLTIKLICDKDFGTIIADKTRFKKIIFKLLAKAIEFHRLNGEIIVEIQGDDENVIIKIKDNAIVNDKLQVKSDSKINAGLGLSVIKNLIELHDGIISLDSEKNTSFVCTFKRKKLI